MRLFQSVKLTLLLLSSSVLFSGTDWAKQAFDQRYQGIATGSQKSSLQVLPPVRAIAPSELIKPPTPELLAQLDSDSAESTSLTGVELCVDLPNWHRPSEQTQRKRLTETGRYDELWQDETLMSLAKDWWTHDFFSFTTYGLSARTDPHYLSGVWTALDHLWDCYDGEQPQRINNGELAELWLINHRFVDIEWRENQYIVTVEPGSSGLQLLYFRRQENHDALPVVITTPNGETLNIMSGDW